MSAKVYVGSDLPAFDVTNEQTVGHRLLGSGAVPMRRCELAKWKPNAGVNVDYHSEFDRHFCSVPYEALGASAPALGSA